MVLAGASISQAAYTPIALQSSSYNADVIVESNATPFLSISTTASIDEGTNNYNATLFELGFDTANLTNGLPPAGSTFTSYDSANYSFKMAPSYTAPNGILIDTQVTNGTFTLTSPKAYATLSFLCTGGNGGDAITAKVYHQDGTSETGTFAVSDWFGGTSGIAVIMNGRLSQVYNLNTETDGASGDGLGNPRVYHKEITLANTTSPVTSIALSYLSGDSGSHNDIMAVSGATTAGGAVTPIAVTGYTYDFVVEVGAPHEGRVVSQTIVNGTNQWATTETLDNENNTANTWYEQGYNKNNDASGAMNNPLDNLTGTGLPHPGSYITNATQDHIYQMPPDYTVNNAIYIGTTNNMTNATITLATPTSYSGLSFLASAGNGPVKLNVVINHQSAASETTTLTVADWYNSSAATAFIANGRVAADTATLQDVNNKNPRLLQNDIVLSDTVDPVTSIVLLNTNTSGGRLAIFAVSGSAGALPPAITVQPASVKAYIGSSISFTSAATANTTITYQWQKGTNGVYINLSNGGSISGSTSTILNVNNIQYADQADYRLVATDSAGYANSGVGTLTDFSTNTDVTASGDPISYFGGATWGDAPVSQAIDNDLNTKFGMDLNSNNNPSGLKVSPSAGLTMLSALRIYTANDSTGRDPTSFTLEGSVNGGASYTLITSNSIALPDGRNSFTSATALNPLSQYVTEVPFANTKAYTTYRLTFLSYKGGSSSGQMQVGEVELLGTNVSGVYFSTQPTDYKIYNGGYGQFNCTALSSTTTPTISWYRGSNGTYVALNDGGNISGSKTANLVINPSTFADGIDYVAVANSGSQYVTSSVAHLYVYSTDTDVSDPADTITGFGDTTGTRYGTGTAAANVIDNTFTEWENGGSGYNAGGGFPPFGGPVGIIITPAAGSTVLDGLRFYPGQDTGTSDPSGFVLEGSNDGGTTYATIASGSLSLPLARNVLALAVNPIQASAQEVLFSNAKGFTTYRLTFPSVRNPSIVGFLSIGEVEFLGVQGAGVSQPVISGTTLSAGNLNIAGSGGIPNGSFTVLTNANLTVPIASWGTATTGTFDGSGNFSISLPVSSKNPQLFYVIKQ
jgi:hypothetical protein